MGPGGCERFEWGVVASGLLMSRRQARIHVGENGWRDRVSKEIVVCGDGLCDCVGMSGKLCCQKQRL